jgi:zinc transporter 1/2/3
LLLQSTYQFILGGILIGGQTKDTATVWLLLGAICFHMSLIALSVTLRLLSDNPNYIRVFYAMCIWSLMGPLGVFVSLLISSDSSGLSLINGILQCLSAGTFVYITFIDMIHHDLIKTKFYPFVNIILIFSGFLIIVLTTIWHKHMQ